ATSGDIGSSCTSTLNVNTGSLTVTANSGSAYISDAYNTTNSITVNPSTVANNFYLEGTTSTAGSGSILTSGSGIGGAAGGSAASVTLVSDNGNVGGASPAVVKASSLTAQALNGTVNVSDSASAVTLQNCPGCASITNQSSGNYTYSGSG